MSALSNSLIVFACIFGGAVLGMLIRARLPEQHFSPEAKDVLKLGMGLVGTMAALVLGLLVASAKSTYDAQNSELTDLSARVVLLDRVLARYGPETKEAREKLRESVAGALDLISREDNPGKWDAPPQTGELLVQSIHALEPQTELQQTLKGQAINMTIGLGQTRWLMYTQGTTAVSVPMLVVVTTWLTILFVSYGMHARPSLMVAGSLFLSALSVAGALYLILEMYSPYQGLIRVSTAPLRAALEHLGR
jgi:hypothetical protein